MLGPILGSYLTFHCSEGSCHHLHFTRRGCAARRKHLPRVEWRKFHSSQSTPHAVAWTSPGFSFLVSRGAHTTPTLQAWLLVSGSPHASGNVAFVGLAEGDGLICTFFPTAPDPPLWPGLELSSLRTWVLLLSPELFHPAPLSTLLWAFLERPSTCCCGLETLLISTLKIPEGGTCRSTVWG